MVVDERLLADERQLQLEHLRPEGGQTAPFLPELVQVLEG